MVNLYRLPHAYLECLDERLCAEPRGPPRAAEARKVARRTARGAGDGVGEERKRERRSCSDEGCRV